MKVSSTSERLKYLMNLRNIKQVDILRSAIPYADEAGIKMNRSDISQYVSGKVEPGQDKLMVLGKALNVDPVWLLGVDVPMLPNKVNTHKMKEIQKIADYFGIEKSDNTNDHIPTVGENIRTIRTNKGLTQEEFASRIGDSHSSVQNYEMDLSMPSYSEVKKMADVLGVDVFEIIGWNPFIIEMSEMEDDQSQQEDEFSDTDEKHLISNYRSLDTEKKNSLINYSDYLTSQMCNENQKGE